MGQRRSSGSQSKRSRCSWKRRKKTKKMRRSMGKRMKLITRVREWAQVASHQLKER
jgi:hypothetical protein